MHLVWTTWDRTPILTDDIRPEAFRIIGAKCQSLGAQVVALGGISDHVHLLVRLPMTLSIALLLKEIKGASGHALAKHAIADGEFFKWQGAYGPSQSVRMNWTWLRATSSAGLSITPRRYDSPLGTARYVPTG